MQLPKNRIRMDTEEARRYARLKMKISTQDFYRIAMLARAGRNYLDKRDSPKNQEIRNHDMELIDKFHTCWKLGLNAEWDCVQKIANAKPKTQK